MGVKQIFEENDPEHLASFVVNAGMQNYKAWEPYVALQWADDYPIGIGRGRNPWRLADSCKEAVKFTKHPYWIVLQSFGAVGNPGEQQWNVPRYTRSLYTTPGTLS